MEQLPGLAFGVRLTAPEPEAIREYIDKGVEVFHLEATPYLEETYRLGEQVLPLLEAAHAG
ncbi:hypothetical protein [Nonomuraea recticatena]